VAVLAMAVAVALRALLDPWLGPFQPDPTLFGAVAFAVWYGGVGPALLTAVAGYVVCDLLFAEVGAIFGFRGAAELAAVIVYALSCAVIITLGEGMRRAQRHAAAHRDALARAHDRTDAILASIADAFYVLDPENRYVYLNEHAERYFGRPRAEMLGRRVFDVFPELRGRFEGEVLEAQRAGRPIRIEMISPITGRWVEVHGYPSREGLSVFLRDVTDAKRTAAALETKEAQLRLITDALPALIAYVDREGRYQLNNRAYETWFGREPESLRGHAMREVLGEAAWETIRPHVERALAGQEARFETWVDYRDAGLRCIQAAYCPDVDAHGQVRGFVVLVNDVTAQRRVEDERRALQQRFQAFMDNVPARVFIKDEEGRYVFLNHAALKALGRGARDQWRGRTDHDLYPDEVATQLREHDRLVRERGATLPFRESMREADGTHELLTIRFPVEEEGRVLVAGVTLDVTDRVNAERALAESEARYRRIVETASEGIWLLDADGRVTFVNRRMGELLGYEPDEILGRRKWEFVPPQDRERMRALFERRRAGVSEQVDVCFQHRDGRPVWMLMAARPVFDEQGAFRGTLDMCTDVSERRRLEEELRDRLAELAEADRRKDEFLATLAHELRNPLTPVRNAVALLRAEAPEDSETAAVHEMIERQVQQMARLIDDLLDVSRITRSRLVLRREPIDLADAVRSAVETSLPVIDAAEHQLEVELPAERIPLDADLARLSQVFANLLNNAAKFTPKGGHIALRAAREDGEVVVQVRDDGIGISPDQLPGVFRMFSQATSALDRSEGGLGIGLSLVRALVELHGGSVEAHSAGLGSGSVFTVRLPLAEEAGRMAAGAEESSPSERRAVVTPRRILVVDDNRDSADSLAELLALHGHALCTAYDGPEALKAAEDFGPDVVLLDIGLPGMNGYEVARRIRAEDWGRSMRLVALTGWGQESDKRRARESGFDAHATKPVDPARLDALVGAPGSREPDTDQ
jgi:PAS domain S-box-containing protein